MFKRYPDIACADCGERNRWTRPRCRKCGAELQRESTADTATEKAEEQRDNHAAVRCSHCHATRAPSDNFCGRCGAPLRSDPATEGLRRARGPEVSPLFVEQADADAGMVPPSGHIARYGPVAIDRGGWIAIAATLALLALLVVLERSG